MRCGWSGAGSPSRGCLVQASFWLIRARMMHRSCPEVKVRGKPEGPSKTISASGYLNRLTIYTLQDFWCGVVSSHVLPTTDSTSQAHRWLSGVVLSSQSIPPSPHGPNTLGKFRFNSGQPTPRLWCNGSTPLDFPENDVVGACGPWKPVASVQIWVFRLYSGSWCNSGISACEADGSGANPDDLTIQPSGVKVAQDPLEVLDVGRYHEGLPTCKDAS
jgi:hypothetical protein